MSEHFGIPKGFFGDPVVTYTLRQENGESMILLWLKMFDKASRKDKNGDPVFKIADGFTIDSEALAHVFDYDETKISAALQFMETYGLIKRFSDSIVLVRFWITVRDRSVPAYKQWRDAVFERDEYTCQECGTTKDIQAHHIVSWAEMERDSPLRYDVKNGITLCKKCHLKMHGGNWRNAGKKNVHKENY